MTVRYAHTNIVCEDWRRLAQFYEHVFACKVVPPKRSQSGAWLEQGTGVEGAALEGVHLLLPGHSTSGPTLEIYQYTSSMDRPPSAANRRGFGHIGFEADDVSAVRAAVLEHGGTEVGRISEAAVRGVGTLRFVYMADPEGNLIELQSWVLGG